MFRFITELREALDNRRFFLELQRLNVNLERIAVGIERIVPPTPPEPETSDEDRLVVIEDYSDADFLNEKNESEDLERL